MGFYPKVQRLMIVLIDTWWNVNAPKFIVDIP